MRKSWVMVRVTAKTKARLDLARQSMLRAFEQGRLEIELDHTGHLSVDQVIGFLLDARQDHLDRARRSKHKRRKKAKIEILVGPAVHPVGWWSWEVYADGQKVHDNFAATEQLAWAYAEAYAEGWKEEESGR